jgi:DNA-binding HxlR family transcriptional regulator
MGVSKKEISPCPIDTTLSIIDGRWKGTILWRLLDGPMRTSELRKSIPEITERMLLRHLRDLTESGILDRHQEQGLPLRVRYKLTGASSVDREAPDARCGHQEELLPAWNSFGHNL